MRIVRALFVIVLLAVARTTAAQPPEPVGGFVVDVRGSLARFKADAGVASALGVTADNLPTRGLGGAVGAHWFPFRMRRVAFGLGGELMFARDSRTKAPASETAPEGPTVSTRYTAMAPQISLNIGHRDGWSYVSAGLGRARLTAERDDLPFADDGAAVRVLNYGGGARWFTSPHVAFTFDVRFHTVAAQAPVGTRPAFPRTRFMVLSAGVSFR